MPTRSTGFSPATKELIRDRACYRCERCGERTSDCVGHHRRPRGLGGSKAADTNLPSNAAWLCGMCHIIVESSRDQAFDDGFLVRQWQDPAQVPMWYRKYSPDEHDAQWQGRPWLLGVDGSVMPSDWEGEVA